MAEPGLRIGDPGRRCLRPAAEPCPRRPPCFAAESAEPVEDLTPSEMTVEVAVEVGFRIL